MINLLMAVIMIFSSFAYAATGSLLNITASGSAASADGVACLNGAGAISCQNFHVEGQHLQISTVAKHNYPAVGIKILTPGYTLTGCTPSANGYCLFAVNWQTPATILLNGNSNLTVGGTISGLVGSISLQNNGTNTLTQSSNGSFTFSTPVAEGTSYNVTISHQPTTQVCTVSNGSGIMGSSSVTNIQIICNNTVGGTISGLVGSVSLQNNGTDTLTRRSDGRFAFSTPLVEGTPYHVTVSTQPSAQTCTVNNGRGIMGSSAVTNIQVTCSTNSYTVGGTISGLVGSVTLQNDDDLLTQSSNGGFTFATPVAEGATYHVKVSSQPSTQTCTVNNGTGRMGGANVTNVQVICSTNSYTVGGTISGLVGSVSLQNNDNDDDTLTQSSDGSFTFAIPVAEGAAYNVTVSTQPATQTCTISNGSGTMGNAPVTNVSVSCVAGNTTLSVDATGTIPLNSGSGSITVTNTGTTNAAANISVTLPSGWIGVTQNASACTSIPPNNGTCTITFTTTTPYVAQGGLLVTGDNITSPPTTALAVTINGYLIWEVTDATTVQVIDNVNVSNAQWGNNVLTNAQSLTDGQANTSMINSTAGIGSSAAVNCYNSTNGGAAIGTWYLPAICQLIDGVIDRASSCPSGLSNINSNLVQLGFGNLSNSYWSSTEASISFADLVEFIIGGSGPLQGVKSNVNQVRCAESLTY